tara:strand:+ start:1111 stop:1404 length:294 start_codon:yes stop_codon:yes gene_type:complete
MIELIAGIIEAIVGIFTSIIEAIASLFVSEGIALGAGEAIAIFFLIFVELFMWAVLWIVELLASLFLWRRPKRILKPVLWRPAKLKKAVSGSSNESN